MLVAAESLRTGTMLVDVCSNLAPIAAIFVFTAPYTTIQQVRREKTVRSLPLLPYSSMVSSAFLWTTYGILRKEFNIWSSNIVGFSLGIYYMLNFMKNAPKASPTLPGSQRQHAIGVLAMIIATLLVAMSPLSDPASLIGPFGVALTIAMFASPLSALKTVIETKSAVSIPLPFTLATLVNCLMWSVTGLFRMKDANIYFPNLLGLSFSLVQVALKLVYGDGLNRDATKLPT